MNKIGFLKWSSVLGGLTLAVTASAAQLTFSVSYPKEAFGGQFSGRVVVYLGRVGAEPRFGPDWFAPQPCYSASFSKVKPGDPMILGDSNAVGFPGKLHDLPSGDYSVQAVVDRDLGGRAIGSSPGNLYGAPQKVHLDYGTSGEVKLTCDRVVNEPEFADTQSVREVRLESKLLSNFYRRSTIMRAGVVLPDGWGKDTERKYPVIYEIPGFGGNHLGLSGHETHYGTVRDGQPFIFVILDPDCPTGHNVFADSANNGPWGQALTTELIPYIEKAYRGLGQPGARFVTGHSSGGWSSLWLQVTYPEVFGGVWSTSPDPVDFRDFQRINLYQSGTNMFTDEKGQPRPLARVGNKPIVFYKPFSDMERPIRGEQLGSFEAVFSPKGKDGQPLKLWDRDTGAIDPKVADAWKKYDIGLTLRSNWPTLGPKLAGKIHVYMGNMDTFYLDGAVRLLKKDMADLGSDAVVEMVPGDHGSMMTAALRTRIDHEMAAQFKAWEKKSGRG